MLPGALVIDGVTSVGLWQWESQDIQVISGVNPIGLSVSPYHNLLAWVEEDGVGWWRPDSPIERITLASEDSVRIRQWLANDRLLISTASAATINSPTLNSDEFTVVDLQRNNLLSTSINLPRPLAESHLFGDWRSIPAYDPYLENVVYATSPISGNSAGGLVLWDIMNQTERWVSHAWTIPLEFSEVNWRLDEQVAILVGPPAHLGSTARPELLYLDKSGFATPLTRLQELPELSGQSDYLLYRPRWSPDGRYIGFILSSSDQFSDTGGKLLVFDTASETLIDFCIDAASYLDEIYWSPTSGQIAFTNAINRYIYILDLEDMYLSEVKVPGLLKGWLNVNSP